MQTKHSDRSKQNLFIYIFVSIGLIGIIFYLSTSTILRELSYDEVNYMISARQPFIETWSSMNTLSFVDFVKLSLDKIGFFISRSDSLIDEQYDNFYLRNFHGPLFVYPISAIANLDLGPDFTVWLARMLFFSVFILSIPVYIYLKESQRDRALIQMILCFLLILLTPGLLEAGLALNVHLVLTVLTLFSILSVEKIIRSPGRYPTVAIFGALCACLVVTTVTALVVITSFYIYMFFKVERFLFKKIFYISTLSCILTLLVLNPGFFYSFDIAKAAFKHLYRIIFIRSEYTQLHIGVNAFLTAYLPLFFASLSLVLYKFISSTRVRVVASNIAARPINYYLGSLEFFVFIIYGAFIVPFLLNPTYFLLPSVLLLLLTTQYITELISTHARGGGLTFLLALSIIFGGAKLSDGVSWAQKTRSFDEHFFETREAFRHIESVCESQRVSGQRVFSFDYNEIRLRTESCNFVVPLIVDYDGKTLLYRSDRRWLDFISDYGASDAIIIIKSTRVRELDAISQVKTFRKREISSQWALGRI